MKKNLIDQFFLELDREWKTPAEIILTGAAAGALLGQIRPSTDIDFEIRPLDKKAGRTHLEEAIQKASAQAGIAVNYSEDISHWSMIDYLDYRKMALPYKKIGQLQIKIMAPEYWTIGKMSRFLESDTQDILKIIRKKRLGAERLAKLWGKALRSSPLSLSSGQFRHHVVYFFTHYGRSAWGKDFDLEKIIILFKKEAGLK